MVEATENISSFLRHEKYFFFNKTVFNSLLTPCLHLNVCDNNKRIFIYLGNHQGHQGHNNTLNSV